LKNRDQHTIVLLVYDTNDPYRKRADLAWARSLTSPRPGILARLDDVESELTRNVKALRQVKLVMKGGELYREP
jgi:hypothetical protein